MSPSKVPANDTSAADSFNQICTVRIELLDADPLIWREVEVPTAIITESSNHIGRGNSSMTVKRIVTNIPAEQVGLAKRFYGEVFDMDLVMDLGWIVTFAAAGQAAPQISVATEGGSGTPVPDVSIEVDNLDVVHKRAVSAGFEVEYGPVREPWGVTRFYLRDPFGRLINVLAHD